VHEIIGPLTKMTMPELLEFTRMTGDLVKAMRNCPQPVIGAIDGICAGAGAMMALACDMRLGHGRHQDRLPVHPRVGWLVPTWAPAPAAARDRPGAGQRAAVHRPRHDGQEGLAWGFFNALHDRAPTCCPRRRRRPPSWPPAPPSRTA
jgi:enoyl-CoA hydratase/carnithine racemase